MALPFTIDQFFGVFREYNMAVWPMQAVLTALALACIGALLKPRPWSGTFISAVLAVFWAWLAFAYHVSFSRA